MKHDLGRTGRLGFVAGLPMLAAAGVAVVTVLLRRRVPDPLAVHFAADGVADGFAAPGTLVLVELVAGAVLAVLWFALGRRTRPNPVAERVLAAAGAATGWVLAWAGSSTLIANLDRAIAVGARVPAWNMPALFGGMAVVAALAWWIPGAPPPVRAQRAPSPSAPRLPLTGSERAVWSSVVHSPVGLSSAVLVVALGAALATVGPLVPGLAMVLVGLLLSLATVSRVTAGPHGLQVTLSALGRPR